MKVFIASLRHIIATAGVDDALLEVGLAHVIRPVIDLEMRFSINKIIIGINSVCEYACVYCIVV